VEGNANKEFNCYLRHHHQASQSNNKARLENPFNLIALAGSAACCDDREGTNMCFVFALLNIRPFARVQSHVSTLLHLQSCCIRVSIVGSCDPNRELRKTTWAGRI